MGLSRGCRCGRSFGGCCGRRWNEHWNNNWSRSYNLFLRYATVREEESDVLTEYFFFAELTNERSFSEISGRLESCLFTVICSPWTAWLGPENRKHERYSICFKRVHWLNVSPNRDQIVSANNSVTFHVGNILRAVLFAFQNMSVAAQPDSILIRRCVVEMFIFS